MKIEKYSDLWVLHLASSTQGVRINPLKWRRPKWHNKLFSLSKRGLLKKKRFSCADFEFTITENGKMFMRSKANENT